MSKFYLRYVVERTSGSVPAFTFHYPVESINRGRQLAAMSIDNMKLPGYGEIYSDFAIVSEDKKIIIERIRSPKPAPAP